MKTIALLTDFSQEAHQAIHFAVELGRTLQARLVVVHSFDPNNYVPGTTTSVSGVNWSDPTLYVPNQLELTNEREKMTRENLWRLVEDIRQQAQGLEVQGEVILGVGMDSAVTYLQTQAVDLVVMGTKGADSALERWAGTNTAYVMNHAPCPVLAVPAHADYHGIRKIVYATDPFQEEEWHLRELQALAQIFRAEITVLYVQDDLDSQESEDRWQAFVNRWSTQVPSLRFARQFNDKTAEAIEEYAHARNADLLVVAKHHRSFWNRLFGGTSPADRLVFDNVLPTLSLPPLEEGQAPQGTLFSS
ncbi:MULTISPECIES: universal stress protein [Rufibacter]|uniref:Nucleotide-binding universal stress UspA family protein n=1 Tax=Rufibacter quisquiliarum TaxID=1549639 RepID=A0A839GPA9_9BACT|nr:MULTISPECIES: universal stress protein [Rufibacter]MBA9076736.1 nucleotide-binding universal stress UspA family protein [Rufibacter quisquiliarum]